jgi:aromatic-amino-acid transaminase
MNPPHAPSFFGAVDMAPRDPILGITEAYNADTNPKKVNLGVGVYTDDNGKVPLLECVKRAEAQIVAQSTPWTYLPIDGLAAYDKAVQGLLLGADAEIVTSGRACTVQALGGTGGLRVGADFLRRFAPGAQVWISDPSWENHRALFEARIHVNAPVLSRADERPHRRMIGALDGAAGDIVLLHACCHNPTGADLSRAQWRDVADVLNRTGALPFLDLAYQGFGDGIEDGEIVRRFGATPGPLLVASSFSKSFSLYGERVGALSIATASADEAARVLSQLKRIVRTNYSNPPTHGGKIVATVLASPELRALWESELGAMRDRIKAMRKILVDRLHARVPGVDFSFMLKQRGMFSYSGLTKAQVERLRAEHSIYAIDTGRICVAALNTKNVDAVVDAIASVLR